MSEQIISPNWTDGGRTAMPWLVAAGVAGLYVQYPPRILLPLMTLWGICTVASRSVSR